MLHARAVEIANELTGIIKPYCLRIEIAGSVRREKEIVKDIELVLIPENYNRLFNKLGLEMLRRDKNFAYSKNGEKYKQFRFMDEQIDMFIAHPDNWGYLMAIRTGSAEFSHNTLATGWVKAGYKGENGFLTKSGVIVPVREEIDLFNLIGIPYLPPQERI